MRHLLTLVGAGASALWIAPLSAQTVARFISLGQVATPPENLGTSAKDVSGNGMIVVGYAYDGTHTVAARWNHIDGWTTLPFTNPDPIRPASNYLVATNVDGSVAVGQIDGHYDLGFYWKASTGIVYIPRFAGGQHLYVRDLSRDGRFVVGTSDSSSGWRGFRFEIATHLLVNPLQTPTPIANVISSDAWSVSADGSTVLGGFGRSGTTPGYTFTWTLAGGLVPVSTGGAAGIGVLTMSADASVLGGSWTSNVQMNGPPAKWNNNVFQGLPVPAGGNGRGSITIMSDDGLTLAGSYQRDTPPSGEERRPMLWRADLGSVDFMTYITGTLQLSLQGLTDLEVNGVSQDGLVVVGEGRRAGKAEAWMLRLPGALPFCSVDLGAQGGNYGPDGRLDNNDFVMFVTEYFLQDHHADVGSQGGLFGPDGLFNNNDFVVFVDQFFSGCVG